MRAIWCPECDALWLDENDIDQYSFMDITAFSQRRYGNVTSATVMGEFDQGEPVRWRPTSQWMIDVCESEWMASADAAVFVRAVAGHVGASVPEECDTNGLLAWLATSQGAFVRLHTARQAQDAANEGRLVLAGLEGEAFTFPRSVGFVAVVTRGVLSADGLPTAYWSGVAKSSRRNATINHGLSRDDGARVQYFLLEP